MAKNKLDPDLLGKMADKTQKSKQYIREQVSRRATWHIVSSLAAQLLWAKELGLSITSALNRADSGVRDEVRFRSAALPVAPNQAAKRPIHAVGKKKAPNLGATTISFLLQ